MDSRRQAAYLRSGILILTAAALLAGCGLPAAGPQASDIVAQESPQGVFGGYVLVDMDERVASITAAQPRESFKRVFTAGVRRPIYGFGKLGHSAPIAAL